MKIVDLVQGSEEWKIWRASKLGASDASVILGKSPFKTKRQLWDEKVFGHTTPITPAMQRGTDLEGEARAWFTQKLGFEVYPVCAIHDDIDYMAASFDGINTAKTTIVEIKCPLKITSREIPEHYLIQMYHQMIVFRSFHMFYVCYHPDQLEDSFIEIVELDPVMANEIIEAEAAFWQSIINLDPPPPDYKDMSDNQRWEYLVACQYNVLNKYKLLEEELDEMKQEFIDLAGGNAEGHGLKLTKYPVKGRIDYDQIEVLKGINLDKYRKPPTENWRITLEKN